MLQAEIFETQIELAGDIVIDPFRYGDSLGLRQAFQARGNVDGIAIDIAVLMDDVSLVHADAMANAALLGKALIAFGRFSLNSDSCTNRIDDARKLRQKAIAEILDHPPLVVGDGGLDHLLLKGSERNEGAFLIHADEPAIANDVGGQYCGEATLHG